MSYTIDDLAAVVVTNIVPYISVINNASIDEIKSIPAKIGSLYQTLSTFLKDEPAAEKALIDLETNPSDRNTQETLRTGLINILNRNLNLTTTLQKLIEEINQDEDSNTFLAKFYVGMGGGPLAGDTTTDAPPPDVKKKKGKGK